MIDILIFLILAVFAIIAARAMFRHFKGEGSCCCGSCQSCSGRSTCQSTNSVSSSPNKHFTFHIEGMHCAHCAQRIIHALHSIDGVSADVDFRTGIAQITCKQTLDEAVLSQAIEKVGFLVLSVQR